MLYRLLMAIMLAVLWCVIAEAQSAAISPPRTINVTGSAERRVSPDLGVVVLAIQTQADAIAHAVQGNNASTTRVMDTLRKLDIPNLTMRTVGYDVSPMYEEPAPGRPMPNPPKIIGYQVVNRVEVRVPDANPARLSDNVGRVLDTALGSGANRVDTVNFTLRDAQPVLRQVLADATRDATQTATALAAAANVTLGPLLALNAGQYEQPQPPMPLYARAMESSAPAVPIAAGELTIRATVNAVYQIK